MTHQVSRALGLLSFDWEYSSYDHPMTSPPAVDTHTACIMVESAICSGVSGQLTESRIADCQEPLALHNNIGRTTNVCPSGWTFDIRRIRRRRNARTKDYHCGFIWILEHASWQEKQMFVRGDSVTMWQENHALMQGDTLIVVLLWRSDYLFNTAELWDTFADWCHLREFEPKMIMLLQINRDLLVRVVIDSRSKSSKSKLCDTCGRDSDDSIFNSFKYCGYFTVCL